MKRPKNPFVAKGYECFLIVLVVVVLMATPLVLLQIDQVTPEWPDRVGVIVAPEVQMAMRWQKRRLEDGPVMRESWYYYFDDDHACFQRRTLGQREVMADCDSFEDIRPDVLDEMRAAYSKAKAELEESGRQFKRTEGVEVTPELDKVVFHSRTETEGAGTERRFIEFNFKRRQFCNQRWIGAQVDSNTYCENFEDAPPELLERASRLYAGETEGPGL